MPTPTFEELKHWAEQYVALWNAGDKEAWIENWRRVATGEFRMLDPVGTPEKQGFRHCCIASFDLFQKQVRFRIQPGTLFICGNEVAWLLENHFETPDGEKRIGHSIETYRFNEDGSVDIRTFYKVPSHTDESLGDLFQTYLPNPVDGEEPPGPALNGRRSSKRR